jgi:transcriptional regulator with XRE-family HTH domain
MELSKRTNVSVDTIRLIENGARVPRIETLIKLGRYLKEDLIKLLHNHLLPININEIMEYLDMLIINDDFEAMYNERKELMIALNNLNSYSILYNEQDHQSLMFLSDIIIKYKSPYEQPTENIYLIEKYFLETYDNFSIKDLGNMVLNNYEQRLILMLALSYKSINQKELSKKILVGLINSVDFFENSDIKLRIKIIFNLSYICYNLEQDKESFDYSNLGISVCVKENCFYLLEFLVFRKAVAQFYLGLDEATETFNFSLSLCKLKNNFKTYENFESAIKKMYS